MAKRGRKPTKTGTDNYYRTREYIRSQNDKRYAERQKNKIFVKCECGREDCQDKGRYLLQDSIRKTRRLNNGVYICRSCKSKMIIEEKGISDQTREKISESVSRRIREGTFKPNHNSISGWMACSKAHPLGRIYYRSSYESTFIQRMEEDRAVARIESEPFAMQYSFQGITLRYIPDFLLTYIDGHKEIIEIKPLRRLREPQNQAKFKAAQQYCEENGMTFRVLTEKDLGILKRPIDLVLEETLSEHDKAIEAYLVEGNGLNGEVCATFLKRSKTVGTKYWRLYRKKNIDRLEKRGVLYFLKDPSTSPSLEE